MPAEQRRAEIITPHNAPLSLFYLGRHLHLHAHICGLGRQEETTHSNLSMSKPPTSSSRCCSTGFRLSFGTVVCGLGAEGSATPPSTAAAASVGSVPARARSDVGAPASVRPTAARLRLRPGGLAAGLGAAATGLVTGAGLAANGLAAAGLFAVAVVALAAGGAVATASGRVAAGEAPRPMPRMPAVALRGAAIPVPPLEERTRPLTRGDAGLVAAADGGIGCLMPLPACSRVDWGYVWAGRLGGRGRWRHWLPDAIVCIWPR